MYGLFVSCTWCFDCGCLWFDFRELEFLRFLRWVCVDCGVLNLGAGFLVLLIVLSL